MERKDYFIGLLISVICLISYLILMGAIMVSSIMEINSSSTSILALVFSILGVLFIFLTIVLNFIIMKLWKQDDEKFLSKKFLLIFTLTCNFLMNVILIIVFAINNMPTSFTLGISIAFHLFVFVGITIANSLILKEVVPIFNKGGDKK